ncbi:helix-turn-helix domain-containing protein [Rhodococcus hoagii]|nr:helix-turn-helix domain-containing protein [Prescottella equi]NKS10208.1 helix-turn-helix domain-containing protein [Prescottella equi]NKS10266.1 helix-turn-helix domain-containing protein [Prescottella equi]NKS35199.1 helix-turn-helix domain-containing protein [Prescottella equi]NKS35258.1 helix-turn-helix domain-containing protein [Prescottella equi]
MANHVRVPRMSRRVLRGFDAARLADLRAKAALTRGELARLAGVSIGAVQSWETGRAMPQVDTLARVVEVLGVSIDQVVLVKPEERYLGDLRVMAGLTQPQLAAKIALSTTSLSSLELGQTGLTDDVADRIANALDLPVRTVVEAYERTRTRPRNAPA